MRTVKTLLKNDVIFHQEENLMLSKEEQEEVCALLRKYGVLKPWEDVSLVDTIIQFTVEAKKN